MPSGSPSAKSKPPQKALQRGEEKFRALLEAAPDAIVGVDEQGRVVFANKQTEVFFQYSREELLGRAVEILLPWHRQEPHVKHRAAYLSHPRVRSMSASSGMGLYGRRKDGSEFPAEISLNPLETKEGVLVISIIRDITEREKAEEALRFTQFASDHSPVAACWMGSDARFIYVNKEACRSLGYTREELLSKAVCDINPDYPAEAWPEIWKKIKEHGSFTFETRHRAKDGRTFPVEITTNYLTYKGKEYNCSLIRDLTERKQLEAQLLQAQKMEAIGRLASGVAHDFNNLLVVIRGNSHFLREKLSHDKRLSRAAEEIDEAADHVASLTNQLLVFSREQVQQPKVLDLNAVVSDTSALLRRLIGESIHLGTLLDPALGRVKADPGQMGQVIINLAVNARDAMPQGGRLLIGTENIEVDESYARQHAPIQPGFYVLLSVTDTGVGMDKETKAHIFEPFFTTKESGKGSGLGLATVYGIIKQSEGYLWVSSEPAWGTTFEIYLPRVASPTDTVTLKETEKAIGRGRETVLLVEDEAGVLKVEREFLKRYGYHTLIAGNAAAALKLAERCKSPIHLLVTDVVMPDMNGHELAQRLVQLRPDLKVLYVSGYTDNLINYSGATAPVAAFLYKPFTAQTLACKVREVLDASGSPSRKQCEKPAKKTSAKITKKPRRGKVGRSRTA